MLSLVNFTAFDKLRLTLSFNFKGLKLLSAVMLSSSKHCHAELVEALSC